MGIVSLNLKTLSYFPKSSPMLDLNKYSQYSSSVSSRWEQRDCLGSTKSFGSRVGTVESGVTWGKVLLIFKVLARILAECLMYIT